MPARRRLLPVLFVAVGLAAGVAADRLLLAPAPLKAEVTDRNEKLVMFTCRLSFGSPGEAVFVLDSGTGTLFGGVVGQNGRFVSSYARSIAADFGDRAGNAEYAVVAGPGSSGDGFVYIAENRSGKVVAYGIPQGAGRQMPLVPADTFNFKQPLQ